MSPVRTSAHLEDIAAKFEGVRPNGTGLMARCPAHDDRKQSLHISIGDDGGIVLHCFAGCDTETVLQRRGLTFKDLAPRDAWRGAANGHDESFTLTTYDYRIGGVLRYQSVRKQFAAGSKTFFQRQPKPGGGWINNLKDVKRILYRADELAEDITAGKVVFYVEGEKDVDRMRTLGYAATTHAGGAKAFRAEYAEQLRGTTVFLVPDNDRPGYELMLTAYDAFTKTAAEVHILQITGLPGKSDFSDYVDVVGEHAASPENLEIVEAGAGPSDRPYLRRITREQLAELAKPADEPKDEQRNDASSGPELIYSPFSAIAEESIRWYWPDYLAAGKLHLIAGTQGDGKSTLITDIAARISCGKTLPNNVTVPIRRIGFLVSEDGLADTVRPRLRIHGADLSNILAIEGVRTEDGKQWLSLAEHRPLLRQFITDEKIEILFVDALSDFMGGVKQNDNAEVRSVLTPLGELARETGCAIVGVVHLGKGGTGVKRAVERVLGSGAFSQVARIIWAVTVNEDEEGQRYFGVIKSNLSPEPPTLRWHRDRDMPITWDGLAQFSVKTMMSGTHERTSKTDQAKDFLVKFLQNGPQPRSEVISKASDAGIGRNSLYNAADELGVIKSKEAAFQGAWYWSLPLEEDDDAS